MATGSIDPVPRARVDRAAWVPVLTGADGQRALERVESLSRFIAGALPGGEGDPSLSGGLAGIATLFAALAEQKFGDAEALAVASLENAIDIVAESAIAPSFYSGFSGVGWAADIVDRTLGNEDDDRNEAIDEVVLRLLATADWTYAPYDLINGLVGLGTYALERVPCSSAEECAQSVVTRLAELARHEGDHAYWWTGPHLIHAHRPEYPDGYVDLGVAHGIPGVIAFLSLACAAGIAEATARPLLDGAVGWLLERAAPDDPRATTPYFDAPGLPQEPARSAWCYGDPGVAATLLVAARAVGDDAWERHAIDIARRAASRPVDETGVVDAGLCHGSAGLGHVFNRMYQATGDPSLGEAARYWLGRTLEWCPSPKELHTGVDKGSGVAPPWDGLGVLEGAAGIALALLAATTTAEPRWDGMFLLAVPAASGGGIP